MTGAILWAFVTAGFWGEHKGHWEALRPHYSDLAECVTAQPTREREYAEANGLVGVRTKCVEVNGRG